MLDGLSVFPDTWVWLFFVGIGLILVMLELFVGVETGFDLVCLGSAFIIGGLVTWPVYSWVWTLIVTLIICLAYLAVGRRYVHRWTASRKEKTNVDTLIGKKGVAIQSLAPDKNGRVKVGNEEWAARSEQCIEKGEEIVVLAISGVTLSVEKIGGGNQCKQE
jgi:membrane protein implicated in regulation of membrane protease activity